MIKDVTARCGDKEIEATLEDGELTLLLLKGNPTLGDIRKAFMGRIWTNAFDDEDRLLKVGEQFDFIE